MSRPRKKADATASPSLISRLLAKRGADPLAARLRAERARRRTARLLGLWQASRLYRAVTLLRELLSATELRHFSLLRAPPGLTARFRCLILPLLTDDFPMMAADGAVGGVLTFLSLLLATYRVPFSRAAQKDGMVLRFFVMAPSIPPSYATARRGISAWILLTGGLFFAGLFLFLSPAVLTLSLVLLIAVLLTFNTPEFGLTLLFLCFPFLPLSSYAPWIAAGAVALSLVSYLIKLAVGKRHIHWELCDLLMLVFSLFVLFGGLLAPDSHTGSTPRGAILAVVIAGGYFLSANLLTSRRMLSFFIRTLLLPFSLLAVGGILRGISRLSGAALSENPVLRYLLDPLMATLASPEELTTYLLPLLPLLFTLLLTRERGPRWCFLSAIAFTAAIALSERPFAYAVLILSLLFLVAAIRRRRIYWLIPASMLAPHLLLLIPPSSLGILPTLADPFGLFTALLSRLALWRGAVGVITDAPMGIGLSSDGAVIRQLLSAYGVESESLHHLFFSITVELGIPGLLIFLALLISMLGKARDTRTMHAENPLRLCTVGTVASLFALLLCGLQGSIFSSTTVVLLFSLLLGLVTAARRAAREEEISYALRESPERELAGVEVRLGRS